MLKIIEVNTKKQLKQFIEFPNILYKNCPYYVPSLYLSVKWTLSKKNPFFEHSQMALFLASNNNQVVGRIAAIYNKTHLDIYKDKTGFFGFFDAINDIEVARELFNASFNWLKSKGLTSMMGPTNLTTNDSCGILIDGFNQQPMVSMPYNFDYYADLIETYGFRKTMDLFSYHIDGSAVEYKYKNTLERSYENLAKNNISIRSLSTKNFDEDLAKLRPAYNNCNEHNWGFMPLNKAEFKALADDLKMIAPLDLAIVAEKDNQIIGFIIAIPNINQALKHVKRGKLLPFGFLKLLWYKRKVNSGRILILGLLNEYSGMGLDLVLYKKIKEALNYHGIYTAEACYILDSNYQMNSILKKLNGKCVKKYRIYSINNANNQNS
ncbi:MAG: hypothetical protein GX660_16645 [Clostridiaceae bacterium]|nr:hypothetical protein [Clostridiaceae bacterium]